MTDNNQLEKIGEAFGDDVVALVRLNRAFTVKILRVDDEFAYVTMTGGTEEIPVPLTGISIQQAAFIIKPNVGSLSVVQFADSAENAPFFIAHSQIDLFSFTRGATVFSWEITPTGRDEDGDEIEGETNDVINLAVGESTLNVDKDFWTFNGGALDGLVVLADVVAKLNALEEGYNALVAKYNAHIHITTATVGLAPVGVIAPTVSTEPTVLIPTEEVEIENEKIKQ